MEIVNTSYSSGKNLPNEFTELLIGLNWSCIQKIVEFNPEVLIKVIDMKEFNSLNEGLLVILISSLQCLFIYKDIDLYHKNDLLAMSVSYFYKLAKKVNEFSERFLWMIALFYYEVVYYINMLPSESISQEIKFFLDTFKEFVTIRIKGNKQLKGNYFIDKLIDLVDTFEKKKKALEK